MSFIEEIIRLEPDNTLSFGDYSVKDKRKLDGFEAGGDLYKVKTHNGITRLEKNSTLLFESVPGAVVRGFSMGEKAVTFQIEGCGDTQITLELEPETEYRIVIDDVNLGDDKSNLSGKVSFSMELTAKPQKVRIEKM